MKCYYHPDVDAVAQCKCGKFLCKECVDKRTPIECDSCYEERTKIEEGLKATRQQEEGNQKGTNIGWFVGKLVIGYFFATLIWLLCTMFSTLPDSKIPFWCWVIVIWSFFTPYGFARIFRWKRKREAAASSDRITVQVIDLSILALIGRFIGRLLGYVIRFVLVLIPGFIVGPYHFIKDLTGLIKQ